MAQRVRSYASPEAGPASAMVLRRPPRARRAMALVDVIIGGVMLAIALSVLIALTTRSLAAHTDGEKRLVASWLADELLNMVVTLGPDVWPKVNDEAGTFEAPFDEFTYDVSLDFLGDSHPYKVIASVNWEGNRAEPIYVETFIAVRKGEAFAPRAPLEPLDREARYFEDEEQ